MSLQKLGTANTTVVAIVAVLALVLSIVHVSFTAAFVGFGALSFTVPLLAEGLLVSGATNLYLASERGERAHVTTKLALTTGIMFSLALNVLSGFMPLLPTVAVGIVKAVTLAFPTVALLLCIEQALRFKATHNTVMREVQEQEEKEKKEQESALSRNDRALLRIAEEPTIHYKKLAKEFGMSDSWASQRKREYRKAQLAKSAREESDVSS